MTLISLCGSFCLQGLRSGLRVPVSAVSGTVPRSPWAPEFGQESREAVSSHAAVLNSRMH